MRTKFAWLVVSLAWLALTALVQAQFSYTTNGGAITISGYNPAAGLNVVIPNATNGYPVTSIGDRAFASSGITTVTIPNSVLSIGSWVFEYCGSLTNVTIGTNVTGIGDDAFFSCSSLTSVTIPNGVTSIGNAAFLGCSRLVSMAIPNSVIRIGDSLFANCLSLTNVTIPNSVTSIGNYSFIGCTNLTSITIPDSVTSIGNDDFGDSTSLTNITVDAANPAFSSKGGVLFDKAQAALLQFPGGLGGDYTIPDNVTDIGAYAFEGCNNLTSVTIANSVTNIGDSAFAFCKNLIGVTIPNGVKSMGFESFYYCFSLPRLILPSSVTSIGDAAFVGSISLTNITVDAANPAFSSQSGVLFDKAQASILQFPNGLSGSYHVPDGVINIRNFAFEGCVLTNVTTPSSVTSIGNWAFGYCTNLARITIGTNVHSIGEYAFVGCSKLTSVTIPNSVSNIGVVAFAGCTSLSSAYFLGMPPTDNGSAFSGDPTTVFYLPGMTGWRSTFGSRPAVLWNPKANTFSFTGGEFSFTLGGPSNAVIVVEASADLNHPLWLPVTTNTVTGSGVSPFADPQSRAYPMRYYRFRSP